MSNLTDLVPPLELCKLIPAGGFADSAFVWLEVEIPQKNQKEWRVVNRTKPVNVCHNQKYPAPTLQEIMEAVGGIKEEFIPDPLNEKRMIKRNPQYQPSIEFFPGTIFPWRSMRWTYSIWSESDTTAPEAAIRTYLNLKDVTVTMPCVECGTWLQHLGDDQLPVECFGSIRVSVTEVCPKCGYKYYNGLFLRICHDIEKHLINVNTPMGSRWIKKLSDKSELSDKSDTEKGGEDE